MQAAVIERWTRIVLLAACVAGGILSVVSLRSHYGTSATEYCDLNATFNCDLVNRSTYSELGGVPVALIGLLGYLFLFALSFRTSLGSTVVRFVAAVVGLGFALYLAYVEAYVLGAWCLLCLGSLCSIFVISVSSGFALWRASKSEKPTDATG